MIQIVDLAEIEVKYNAGLLLFYVRADKMSSLYFFLNTKIGQLFSIIKKKFMVKYVQQPVLLWSPGCAPRLSPGGRLEGEAALVPDKEFFDWSFTEAHLKLKDF